MKKLLTIATILFIAPSIAFASWWNPFSWGIFSSRFQDNSPKQTEVISVPQINNLPSTSSNQSTTSTANSDTNASSTIKTPPVINTPKKDSRIVKPVVKTPQQIQPTGELCNGTYWNACPAGQKLICPQTGNAYCQLPTQQPRIVPVATTSTITPIATTTVNKGIPYKGHDGNWYYPNAFDTNGKNLQAIQTTTTSISSPSSYTISVGKEQSSGLRMQIINIASGNGTLRLKKLIVNFVVSGTVQIAKAYLYQGDSVPLSSAHVSNGTATFIIPDEINGSSFGENIPTQFTVKVDLVGMTTIPLPPSKNSLGKIIEREGIAPFLVTSSINSSDVFLYDTNDNIIEVVGSSQGNTIKQSEEPPLCNTGSCSA